MQIRRPIVAHQFYPGQREDCLAEIELYLRERNLPALLPDRIVAGIVPHAGWVFSGDLAGLVFAAIRHQVDDVEVFVILGAAHTYRGAKPIVGLESGWDTPLGRIEVDREWIDRLVKAGEVSLADTAHRTEHSIEVQVPFIQYCFPKARICPIVVPPTAQALSLGQRLGEWIRDQDRPIVCLASTDLTHYGPRYGFVPQGCGREGIRWAAEVNDRRFIDLALAMKPEQMLVEAAENLNACGPGAAAAAVTAAKTFGRAEGQLLAYTNSYRVMADKMDTLSLDSVGYAALVF